MFTTVFISYRGAQGPPLAGHQEGERTIQDILSSIQAWVQSQTYSAKTKGPGAHGGKKVGTKPPQSYEAALQAAHQKALETAEALCNNLERFDDESRERS